jgi:hypothetical protein
MSLGVEAARAPSMPALKVLGFDSWTGGWFNFARLAPALAERGMSFWILHIGSWGSDPGRASREVIGGLEFRDVTFYPGKSFDQIIDEERPDAVVLLSTQTFAHRAFLRYCEQRSIPSLHLYHGIANVQVTDDAVGSHKVGWLSYAAYALPKVGKLLKRTFPSYISALAKTGAKAGEWLRFGEDVARMMSGGAPYIASLDARTTKGAVYTNADVEQAMRIYGFRAEDVAVVGNPDLIRFGFEEHMLGALNRADTIDLPCVMYIDTALAIVGLLYGTYGSFIEHMIATGDALAAQGKKLVFKPHPAHDAEQLKQRLQSRGIEIVTTEQFLPKLTQCCACITETTSAALVPALLGLPMLYARYGELREQRFGPALMSYPRGHELTDLADVTGILRSDAAQLDVNAVRDWIAFNSGPLPAKDMPRRVAELLDGMISKARAVVAR